MLNGLQLLPLMLPKQLTSLGLVLFVIQQRMAPFPQELLLPVFPCKLVLLVLLPGTQLLKT